MVAAYSAGFLLAALINEGLIQIVSEKTTDVWHIDSPKFNQRMQTLMDTPSQKKAAKAKPDIDSQES